MTGGSNGTVPHDAPPPAISDENPMGTDGFEFVEFCHPDPEEARRLFKIMGFAPVARHRSKNVTLYRQGDINFILNAEPGSFAAKFARRARPSAPAMAFRVVDAKHAYERAPALGRQAARRRSARWSSTSRRSRASAGCRSISSTATARRARSTTSTSSGSASAIRSRAASGLYYIDHLTHNVYRGRLNEWAAFYERLFNFRQIRYFDIEGKLTGLHSRAMTSPDGKIRIPINEDAGETGQIEEYLQEYKGEGIQHVALGSPTSTNRSRRSSSAASSSCRRRTRSIIPASTSACRSTARTLERLQKNGILIDGEGVVEGGFTKVLLQRFGKTAIGPIFFEFIQRKGDDGFGEGNFKALFESIEGGKGGVNGRVGLSCGMCSWMPKLGIAGRSAAPRPCRSARGRSRRGSRCGPGRARRAPRSCAGA